MMEAKRAELTIPFLRSCLKESTSPIQGTVTGNIPEWLQGNLIRIGSGLWDVGPDRYAHIFDGHALMHKFSIHKGQITYQNRFLRSDSYKENMKAGRIVVSEFGTAAAIPDPCKTIFQRFASFFYEEKLSDNDLVNIVKYTDEFYACSESNYVWKIDAETLESQKKVNLKTHVPIKTGTPHPHTDNDGTVYNVGFGIGSGRRPSYKIIKFLPKENDQCGAFDRGQVVASVPASRPLAPSYIHSFGMTKNYFIVLEQPFSISVPTILFRKFTNNTIADALKWQPEYETQFLVIRRDNGELIKTKYIAKPIMAFHHINAYEDNDHLVVDICCNENPHVIKAGYRKALEEFAPNANALSSMLQSTARRYIFPLNIGQERGKNLVQLPETTAKAFLEADEKVRCEPEILSEKDWYMDLPRIHYERFNAQKYRYFYAFARFHISGQLHVIKVDTKYKTTLSWKEEGFVPSEPVFVADPSADTCDEDTGILMFSLLSTNDVSKVAIVLLDAKTMTELGRASFETESSVPGDFHGIFIPRN